MYFKLFAITVTGVIHHGTIQIGKPMLVVGNNRKEHRMEIREEKNGGVYTFSISGRIDTVTAPALEAALQQAYPEAKGLVLDFADVDYISSAGLRVLLAAQKVMNKQGSMRLLHVKEEVLEVFEITGFLDILTIEK